MPSISVIIPTINRQQVIGKTIATFQNDRSFEDFELIVVDQSETSSAELLELSECDARLRYLNVDFRGTTRARNFGVERARTDLIVFSEDDVIPCDHYLCAYWEHFANPQVMGATGPVLAPGQQLRSIDEITELERSRLVPKRFAVSFDVDFAHSAVFGAGGNSAYRRGAIMDLGGFDEEYSGNAWAEEYEFSYRFRQRFGSIDYLPGASVVHLAHATGGSRTLRDGKYVRNFCRNSIYTRLRTKQGLATTAKECLSLIRRFVINRTALHSPRPHWIGYVMMGCWDGFRASRLPRKLPLRPVGPSVEGSSYTRNAAAV